MANASGPASQGVIAGDFEHKPSGVHYRVSAENGQVWLSFERPGDPSVNGKRELLYFIGSGHRGRTYLFSVDRFFFESPINWYAGRKVWDMAPAYSEAREIPMNLPAYTSCLECHTTGLYMPSVVRIECLGDSTARPIFSIGSTRVMRTGRARGFAD